MPIDHQPFIFAKETIRMKYRRLNNAELQDLEDEFVRFLAAHSIPVEDWQKYQEHQPDKVNEWIEKFSDFVFEKTLTGVDFLQLKQKNALRIIDVRSNPFQMKGLQVIDNPHIDLTQNEKPDEWQAKLSTHGGKIQLISAEKALKESPNMEKFKLMQQGFLILKDASLYDTLADLQKGS